MRRANPAVPQRCGRDGAHPGARLRPEIRHGILLALGKEAAPTPRLLSRVPLAGFYPAGMNSRRGTSGCAGVGTPWAEWDRLGGAGTEGMLPLLGFKESWRKWEVSPLSRGIQGGAPRCGQPRWRRGLEGVSGAVKVTRKPRSTARTATKASLPERQPGNQIPAPRGKPGCFQHEEPRGCRMLLGVTRGASSPLSLQQLLLLGLLWVCW